MKRTLVIAVAAAALLSSCGTYTGTGAYAGAQFGGILGSAIGGLTGGWRGSDIGTLVGTVGGAVAGAAIGQAAENKRQVAYADARERVESRKAQQYQYNSQSTYDDGSGFDPTNSADDRIYEYNDATYTSNYTAAQPRTVSADKMEDYTKDRGMDYDVNHSLEIGHVRFVDDNQDGILKAGEQAKMVFEIRNKSDQPVFDVQPMVAEVSGNKHIHISPNIHVESIQPHKGIRYTATIKADKKLKDGNALFQVVVGQGNGTIVSQAQELTVRTMRR